MCVCVCVCVFNLRHFALLKRGCAIRVGLELADFNKRHKKMNLLLFAATFLFQMSYVWERGSACQRSIVASTWPQLLCWKGSVFPLARNNMFHSEMCPFGPFCHLPPCFGESSGVGVL